MVEYKINFGKEENEALTEITLESESVKKQSSGAGILFFLAAAAATMLTFTTFAAGANISALVWAVIALASYVMVFGGFKKLTRKRYRRALENAEKMTSGERTYKFEENLVTVKSSLGESRMPWTSYESYGSVSHYLWIRRKDLSYLLIDRNTMPKEDMIELNGYLTKYLAKQ